MEFHMVHDFGLLCFLAGSAIGCLRAQPACGSAV
jgi:hypothetical protein